MITEPLIRERFGDIWPCHNAAFNDLLIRCRHAFDGDLDKMVILSMIGERTLTSERAAGISYNRFLDGQRGPTSPRPINVQSISDCTGIPRETVRRKIAQLIEKGWVERDDTGLLFVLPKASQDLKPITEGTLEYLTRVGEVIARAGGQASEPPAWHNGHGARASQR
jgi:hypothetical protein